MGTNTASLCILFATLYLTQFANEAMYAIWIWTINFVAMGNYILFPSITRLCFGTENYTKNFGLLWSGHAMGDLILAGLDSGSSSLDLSSADLLVTVDTGPGHWEPVLECPLVRLVAEGTVEEGLTRLETVRKILQDIKSKAENVMLSKQTVTDILNPTPDNGYTKKKEKVHRIVLE